MVMEITVVGLGHVGAVVAAALASQGHEVLGVDVDNRKVELLSQGQAPLHERGFEALLRGALNDGSLRFADPGEVKSLGGVVFMAASTPPSLDGGIDLSQVQSALEWARSVARTGTTIAMKSTVPPGTGKSLMAGPLKGSGLLYVANPEFLREGKAVEDWLQPHRVVIGGDNPGAIEALEQVYARVEAPIIVTDTTTAEMIKYSANAFLATKISFINQIASLCDRLGADVETVARGLGLDPRIGSQFLSAGLGYGGSCFPKDVRALDFLSKENGYAFELIRAVVDVNNRQRLLPLAALREEFGSLYGVRTALLGLAFKPDTDDVRGAPSLDIIEYLLEEGAEVRAADPVAVDNARQIVPHSVTLARSAMDVLEDAQAAILVTEWPQFKELPWDQVARVMVEPRFVFDGRNALDGGLLKSLGFLYKGVGKGLISERATDTSVLRSVG
jgi:UDPglucose 6-dehydrogenase